MNSSNKPARRFTFNPGIDVDDNPVDGMTVGLAAMKSFKFIFDASTATADITNVGAFNGVLRFSTMVDTNFTDVLKGTVL
ncbi:hypothetical protein NHF48_001235 [Sphingomonas sp. H160509]|uniref:hypothetical protein n=1 Tax=Sphingomonas sp. H160509 TaxID=2955313 RepID=UPI002096AB85|nr:hypothetical protein [Sphingomonas sp. H160509]MDD1449872.1 hypothetical protein [Sphingomonas sp. H160509]